MTVAIVATIVNNHDDHDDGDNQVDVAATRYPTPTKGGRFKKGRDLLFSAATETSARKLGVAGAKAAADPARATKRAATFTIFKA